MCNFLPPYNVTFLSAPAGFNPVTYNNMHPGPFTDGTTIYTSTSTSEIPNGTYQIQVIDACNNIATCQVIVKDAEPLYTFIIDQTNCQIISSIQIPLDLTNGPFITTAIITSSTANLGFPIPYDVTASISSGILVMQLPEGTYTIQGIDICGHAYSYTFIMPPLVYKIIVTPNNITGCSLNAFGSIKVTSIGASLSSVIITQAPSGYSQILPYNVSFLISVAGSTFITIPNLPVGNYTLNITDSCGNNYVKTVTILANVSQLPLTFYEKRGCGENFDSIAFSSPNGALVSVIITAAPANFGFPLPYNVSFNIASNGLFYMNSLQEGSYTFYTKDVCNQVRTPTYVLTGYHQSLDGIQVVANCGSFNLNMNHSDNADYQVHNYWLQKFNTITNQWTHPITGVNFINNSIPNVINSYNLINSTINYNIASTGTFRILSQFTYYSNGSSMASTCVQNIKTFDYTGELKIISAYAIPCLNGGSQVFLITNGVPPLNYKITTKDGLPFLINNGTSNSFSGLQPGTYNFKVQDVCGNIVNRLFDINTLQEPGITANNLCIGSNGQLSVQPFSFLNYEWWKDSNSTTILSNTNTISFNPLNINDAGVYHVRIYSTTLNSCVDRILNYTILPASLPNAGEDGSKIICGSAANIDLFTILNGNYNTGGNWQEITASGALIGSNFSTSGLQYGTYIFKYTVNGLCNSVDDSIVTITLNPSVPVPIINVNTSYCIGDTIQFSIQSIPNAIYQWNGPNNFSSTLQNPIIINSTIQNEGNYTVKAIVGQCESVSSILINSIPLPQYTYESLCENGIFKVLIMPNSNSFDASTASYLWTGTNNFTSSTNPLIITNQPSGIYNVVVTNTGGCSIPTTISISNTFCDFPNVITPNNDGSNDVFDLTNYDVSLLQVFSRWGRLVYEQDNYTNQWYGQNMNDGFLPDSTYYYFLQLKNGQEKHGWVFVARGK